MGGNYENTEIVSQRGGKIVRKVIIKKDKGFKSITKYHKGKKLYTVKRPIHKAHIKLIKAGKFIPGLFKDCKSCNKSKKRRRHISGGMEYDDIEIGRVSPSSYMTSIPPDPLRFKKYEEQIIKESQKPVSPEEVSSFYAGPTPEEKEKLEREKMMDEDPVYKDPFEVEELKIFRAGKTRRQKTRR